jgi:hypothetical protein
MSVYDLLKRESYMIGVPSRNRTHLIEKRGGLWKYLTKEYPVYLLVRDEERENYVYSLADTHSHVALRTVSSISSIAEKRQRLIQEAIDNKIEHLFIIDDDVALYFRDENLSSKYTSRKEDFDRLEAFDRILYECMALCCETYPIVGLPLKQGSFGLTYMFPKNIPIIRFVCYHVPTLAKEKIKATDLGTVFMSDRYVQLALLEKGYASLSNCRWCVGDPGTGYRGGCSETRTVELQEEAAHALVRRFPKTVALKWKENGLWSERRLDCSINWKAYLRPDEGKNLPHEVGMERICKYKEGYDAI